jgi:hypothetical protein
MIREAERAEVAARSTAHEPLPNAMRCWRATRRQGRTGTGVRSWPEAVDREPQTLSSVAWKCPQQVIIAWHFNFLFYKPLHANC